MATKLSVKHVSDFIADREYTAIAPQIKAAHEMLHNKSGLGNDFVGWLDLPVDYDKDEFARIKAAAERIKKNTEVFIVIGIGGSYLGARAAIEFLKSPNYNALKRILLTSISQATALAQLLFLSFFKSVRAKMFLSI